MSCSICFRLQLCCLAREGRSHRTEFDAICCHWAPRIKHLIGLGPDVEFTLDQPKLYSIVFSNPSISEFYLARSTVYCIMLGKNCCVLSSGEKWDTNQRRVAGVFTAGWSLLHIMGIDSHLEMPLILQIWEELPPAANLGVRGLLLARVSDFEHYLLGVAVPLAGHHPGQLVWQGRARNNDQKNFGSRCRDQSWEGLRNDSTEFQ